MLLWPQFKSNVLQKTIPFTTSIPPSFDLHLAFVTSNQNGDKQCSIWHMKNKSVQIFKVYQKNRQSSFGTGQSETFYMKVINLDHQYFSAVLDLSELSKAANFVANTQLLGWLFTCYFVEVDGVFYQTEDIRIDKGICVLSFHYFDKLTETPFNVKW
jgi:hypothetical protein